MTNELWDVDLLAVPELDEAFAARTLRAARAELAPDEAAARLPSRRFRGAVVPLLLLSAGGCRTALTVEAATRLYSEPEKKPR